MIHEIARFTEDLLPEINLEDYIRLFGGLHILVSTSLAESETLAVRKEFYAPPKGRGADENLSLFLQEEILPRSLHTAPIDSNKSISDKKILTASPFAFCVKKSSLEDKEWMPKYQKQVATYFEEAKKKCNLKSLTPEEEKALSAFENYCLFLPQHLALWEDYEKLKITDRIFVYSGDFLPAEYESTNGWYRERNVFVKDDYSISHTDGDLYGMSGFNNGDNSKKPYLKHLTASFEIGSRVSKADALLLTKFSHLLQLGVLTTNPLPIFIDDKERNKEIISTVRREGKAVGFHGLMKQLANSGKDIGNYYLFYIFAGELLDVDYISSFLYKLKGEVIIEDLFLTEGLPPLTDIFDLERNLLQPLFANQLVSQTKDGFRYRYFDDLKFNNDYHTDALFQSLLQYRQAWYDYIYKSRRQAITTTMFHQMMLSAIVDDLRHDKHDAAKKSHTKEYAIKQKLNRWFSLWNYFNTSSENPEISSMPSQLRQLQERMRLLSNDPKNSEELASKEEFAFAAGQLIDFLFSKSKADAPTHAMLETFLQKNSCDQFKAALAHTTGLYKHEIERWKGKGRFERIAAQVFAYEYTGHMKDLTPMLLAGYFSKSAFYEKAPDKESEVLQAETEA